MYASVFGLRFPWEAISHVSNSCHNPPLDVKGSAVPMEVVDAEGSLVVDCPSALPRACIQLCWNFLSGLFKGPGGFNGLADMGSFSVIQAQGVSPKQSGSISSSSVCVMLVYLSYGYCVFLSTTLQQKTCLFKGEAALTQDNGMCRHCLPLTGED